MAEIPSPLSGRLHQRIADEGPITFAAFMEAALYDPQYGFYARARVGDRGDFVTSPHLSSVFGSLLARQVAQFWELLERPTPFHILELGAGTGDLARSLLDALPPNARKTTRYVAIERSPAARAALSSSGLEVAGSLDEVGASVTGCMLANEVLDNFPAHRVRMGPKGLVELFVAVAGSRFVLVERQPSSRAVLELAPSLSPGEEAAVSPAVLDFVDRFDRVLDRGYFLIVDYGWVAPEDRRDMVHAYRGHRWEEDVLTDPGSRDITVGIDFAALAARARLRGLPTWGPVAQREALLALGFRAWHQEARRRQVAAIDARRGIEALRIYSDRTRANLLLAPGGLGSFHVLCIGVSVHPADELLFTKPPGR